jgi:hypothetical protein
VLPDPTPDNIRELVDRIVRVKMDAGQLDDTPLTMQELTGVKAQFASGLTGMYHQRIDYPATRESAEAGTGRPAEPRDEGQGAEAAHSAAGVERG